jgi:NAD+ diphosphatase
VVVGDHDVCFAGQGREVGQDLGLDVVGGPSPLRLDQDRSVADVLAVAQQQLGHRGREHRHERLRLHCRRRVAVRDGAGRVLGLHGSRVTRVSTLPYNGRGLDRTRRTDATWLRAARANARVLAFWRDRLLIAGGTPVDLRATVRELVFLGDGTPPVFAADLSELTEEEALAEAGADAAADTRSLFLSLGADDAATVAYGRGMLHWTRNQRFCGACGGPTEAQDAGHVRRCGGCGKLHFPRIEPAVIMLVEDIARQRCLLARHRGAAEGAYSTLAGFVEIGESLEDAVRRELVEEAGVRVDAVSYQASQAWPFPSGLMVAFRATAADDTINVDHDELVEAHWFTRDEVRTLEDRRPDSIETFLVETWLAEG